MFSFKLSISLRFFILSCDRCCRNACPASVWISNFDETKLFDMSCHATFSLDWSLYSTYFFKHFFTFFTRVSQLEVKLFCLNILVVNLCIVWSLVHLLYFLFWNREMSDGGGFKKTWLKLSQENNPEKREKKKMDSLAKAGSKWRNY